MHRVGIAAAFIATFALLTTGPVSAELAPPPPVGNRSVRSVSEPPAALLLSPSAVPTALRPEATPVRAFPTSRPPVPGPVPQERNSHGVPFMVAGGALFVAGAVVGGSSGTILMLGGAGIGAYGLFVYFGGRS